MICVKNNKLFVCMSLHEIYLIAFQDAVAEKYVLLKHICALYMIKYCLAPQQHAK